MYVRGDGALILGFGKELKRHIYDFIESKWNPNYVKLFYFPFKARYEQW